MCPNNPYVVSRVEEVGRLVPLPGGIGRVVDLHVIGGGDRIEIVLKLCAAFCC